MKKGKKISGGRYRRHRKKRLHELAGQKIDVKLGEEKRKIKRVTGGNKKTSLLNVKFINIMENSVKGKKTKKVEIKNVIETPSNKFLARQNIVTKGTIVETEIGKAKITNRPSQEGTVNGVLVEE